MPRSSGHADHLARKHGAVYLKRWPRGRFVSTCRVRCNARYHGAACDARRTLEKPIHEYIRLPKCRVCGARNYRPDRYRACIEAPNWRRNMCDCHGYGFRHRRGGGYCIYNPDREER